MEGKDCPHVNIQNAGAGPDSVAKLNLDGDQQSGLTVHGGLDKAVYPIRPSITHFGARNFLQ